MQIKKGMEEKYKKYLMNNVESFFEVGDSRFPNSYALAVILVAELVGEDLDEGIEPQISWKHATEVVQNLTGYMAGAAASIVVGFHPRGDEFQKWWNKYLGGTGEEKEIINPAIVTISQKPKKAD